MRNDLKAIAHKRVYYYGQTEKRRSLLVTVRSRLGLQHQSCSRWIRTDYHELFSQNTHEHREIFSFCLFVRLFPAVPI